jgi:chromosomal replication initiator protein
MKTDDEHLRESTIKSIQEAVARSFDLPVEELRGGGKRVVVVARHIAVYLVKQMTDASLSEIGQHCGGRHHTTVMHSVARIHDLRRRDAALDKLVSKLTKSLVQS